MGHIRGKLDLSQFKHSLLTGKNKEGKAIKGIFIPIDENFLFKGKNGNIYFDFIGFDAPKPEFKQTHSIKQSFAKDKFTKEELSKMPFFGSLDAAGTTGGEAAPQRTDAPMEMNVDDLPF